jgi:hypothetical protein
MSGVDGADLRSGYRVIRRMAGGRESPWPGVLVSTASSTSAVLVDAAALGAEWQGWRTSRSGHLCAALDVIRRPDGHDVLLPVCTERVADFVERRRSAKSPVGPGEAVNLAVSLLRGLSECADVGEAEGVRGTWWLTDSGRPVLAVGSSEESAMAATVSILEQLAEVSPSIDDAVAQAVDAIRRGAVGRDADRLEAGFFAAETPRPLGTTVFGARAARSIAAYREEPTAVTGAPDRGQWWATIARHVDADWADTVSRMSTATWRALRAPRTRRRRAPWFAAAAIAGIVLTAGLLWPSGEDDPATASGSESGVGASPTGTPAPSPSDVWPTTSPEASIEPSPEDAAADLVSITDRLLTDRSACGADSTCLSSTQESTDQVLATGTIDLAAAERTLTLLDEFGGVAVLRADARAAGTPAQLVVIVRIDDRWLLRDVHDVAQQ